MRTLCKVCGCDRSLDHVFKCPICDEGREIIKIFIHQGKGHYIGSHVVVTAVSLDMAEQFIRHKLDIAGLSDEKLNVHEVLNSTNQSSLVLMVDGDY